ncbi:hypothetical protein K466DRAFT_157395 [Polyporus arcularius HHB13444]|uniref:Uncharacterized protein n=1 Tax=Polyporus arcularius HHB13444 TaxID=1314778 RepID=A0A5C3P9C6_9APHY|nr:hypothetical protein K466DRAFT_157395 [Polyporus arcularius HHB13444]
MCSIGVCSRRESQQIEIPFCVCTRPIYPSPSPRSLQTLPPVPDLSLPFPPPSTPITSLPLPRLAPRNRARTRWLCLPPAINHLLPPIPKTHHNSVILQTFFPPL